MGKGIVEQLEKEFPLQVEWLPFEVHPATPAEGVEMTRKFPGMDMQAMVSQLNMRGSELGLRFNPWTKLSNSRQALEAGEFAKEQGVHDEMHEALFHAYFVEGRDIGQREVILDAARSAGLDTNRLNEALNNQTCLPRLIEAGRQVQAKGITAAPTFEIANQRRIVGVMAMATFRQALRQTLEDLGGE